MNFDDWDGSGLAALAICAFILFCIVVVFLLAEKARVVKKLDAPDEERYSAGNTVMHFVIWIAGTALAIFLLSYIVPFFN